MSNLVCIRVYVAGRVQGVWFRASTKEQADQLGITGWAKNLPDGRVEVVACGEREQMAILAEWLKDGPRGAEVTEYVYEEIPVQKFEGFLTK